MKENIQYKKQNETRYYTVKVEILWALIATMMLLTTAAYFKEELYQNWLHSQKRVEVSIVGMRSELADLKDCYLCGSNKQSLINDFRKTGTIGMIELNDWYVINLGMENYAAGNNLKSAANASASLTNTGEVIITMEKMFNRGTAAVSLELPETYKPNTRKIRQNLCQECLDKVLESLTISRWKYEKKEPVPLCLIDFSTLDIYSLQDWSRGCAIQNYWVDIETREDCIEIKIFEDRKN